MNCEIDDHADVRHARRKRSHPGNRDGKDVLLADRFGDRLHGRIETFDMADHQSHIGAARRGDDLLALCHGRSDRLFDQHVHAARDAGERNLAMQVGRRGNRDRVNPAREKLFHRGKRRAPEGRADKMRLLAVGIDHSCKLDARKFRQHARMVRTHDADPDDTHAQRRTATDLRGLQHGPQPPSTAGADRNQVGRNHIRAPHQFT